MHMVIFVMPLNVPVSDTPAQVHTSMEAITLSIHMPISQLQEMTSEQASLYLYTHPPVGGWMTCALLPHILLTLGVFPWARVDVNQ